MAIQQYKNSISLVIVTIACLALMGCQTMNLSPNAQSDIAPPIQKKVIGQYQVQLMPKFGKATVEKMDITSPMTVQDALVAVNASEKFRAMDITLSRVIKDRGQVLKFPIGYQTRTRSVRPEQDYQILPGDTISISSKSSGSIDKMIESLTGGIN